MTDELAASQVSCDTCPAACCKAGSNLVLSLAEYERNRRSMKLSVIAKPRTYPQVVQGQNLESGPDGKWRIAAASPVRVPAHHGFYLLLEDCGNLEPVQPDRPSRYCTIYSDRPKACRAYEVGSSACRAARAAAGLDGQAEIPDEVRVSLDRLREWTAPHTT